MYSRFDAKESFGTSSFKPLTTIILITYFIEYYISYNIKIWADLHRLQGTL